MVNRDDVSRGNARDALVQRLRAIGDIARQVLGYDGLVRLSRNRRMREYGGDVRRADHASRGYGVVQRADAHVIPCEQHPPPLGIPRDERKISYQVRGCIDVPLRDRFERQPRIRRRGVTAQQCEQLIAIVETAIEGDDETAMRVDGNGIVFVGGDEAQARQGGAVAMPDVSPVGAATRDGRAESMEEIAIHRRAAVEEQSGEAAHQSLAGREGAVQSGA